MIEEATAPEATGQVAGAAPVSEGQAPATEALTTDTTPVVSETPTAWYAGATDETVGYIQNKGWTENALSAVESYQALEKFQGASEHELMRFPKDPAAEGAMDDIYTRMGRPDTADKYTVELPEGVQMDESRLGAITTAAHKHGVSQEALQAIALAEAEHGATAMAARAEEIATQQEIEYKNLQQEWGANHAEREELARRGLRDVLPEGTDKVALSTAIEEAIGTANTLKLFANVGQGRREDSIHDSSGDKPFGYTKEQASSDKSTLMAELKGDKERLSLYNKGVGDDINKMKRFNEILSS